MNKQRLKIFNGRIITPGRIISNGTVVVEDGIIKSVTDKNIEVADAVEINAGGNYIAPGFIDLHIHGGGGSDFMDSDVNAFLTIAKTHCRYGTTSMVPTTLSCGKADLFNTLQLYKEAVSLNQEGAAFLGMHIEGPYFALNQRGAQDARFIKDPDPEEYQYILSNTNVVKRWSAAPELRGALEFATYLRSKGVLPALAHTDAVYEEVIKAYDYGYTLATHLYSGMSGVTRRNAFRYAGVIESAFLIDGMDVEIIADGIHLPAPLLKLIYKIKGPDRIALITDAMRAAAMPEGESMLGNLSTGLKVIIEDGVAKLPDRSSFAGSVATADRLVRNMINLAEVSITDAVTMMTSTPARIMGVDDRKGNLVPGKDADIVLFDEQVNICTTIVKGKILHNELAIVPLKLSTAS